MLYTRKGDSGTTKTFDCDQRISKSSAIAEALGALDEANSFLGLCKVRSLTTHYKLQSINFSDIIHQVQENLFIVQAELAGAPKSITEEKVKEVEKLVDSAEKELPPIKTFFISGGSELGATFDFARTLARRAERRVVAVSESFDQAQDKEARSTGSGQGKVKVGASTLAYLNRLSSLLYALVRLSNHFAGIEEKAPSYK